jgi:hypothetical protein
MSFLVFNLPPVLLLDTDVDASSSPQGIPGIFIAAVAFGQGVLCSEK